MKTNGILKKKIPHLARKVYLSIQFDHISTNLHKSTGSPRALDLGPSIILFRIQTH